MAGPELSPAPSSWLLVLLMLLSGQTVFAVQMLDVVQNPTGSRCSQIWQFPRFVAKKRGSVVEIKCNMEEQGSVSWFWKRDMNSELKEVALEPGRIERNQSTHSATLTIKGIQFQDNGIYICQQECPNRSIENGCGTELRVLGFSTLAQLKRRNALKDGIIMIQTTLIILFITVPIFLLLDKDDSKPGMEEDHTYEGLNIDQTATYEDIVTLRTGEVKWSVGEHPGQE